MSTYIIYRLIQAIFVAFIVSILVFLAMRLLPGDPIYMIMTADQAQSVSPEKIEQIRHEYGLDKSLPAQYIDWIGGVVTGNLGMSIMRAEPVIDMIGRRLPVTMYLGILSVIVATVLGVLAGVICAVRRATWIDTLVTLVSYFGLTVPVFWLGYVLIYFIGLKFGWLPLHGFTSPFENPGMHIKQLIMPVFCLSVFSVAANARQTRSSMLEVLHQDYIRTAWSKGLSERIIIIKHALKNALIPVVTLIGMQLRYVIGGAVLVETIFAINGIGTLVVNSVINRDYPVVQGVILLIALLIILVNLVIDISYGWLDPRIRYE